MLVGQLRWSTPSMTRLALSDGAAMVTILDGHVLPSQLSQVMTTSRPGPV